MALILSLAFLDRVGRTRLFERTLMKLGRLDHDGRPVLGAFDDGVWLNLSDARPDLPTDPVSALTADRDGVLAAIASADRDKPCSGRVLNPLTESSRLFCIGLNYRDHAEETNSPIPAEPIVFNKFSSALQDPGEPIVLPRVSSKVDFEAELVVVIGKPGKHIAEADALSHVLGYANGTDVSARDWQKEKPGKQWLLGKTFDTFAPVGPYLVTADEIDDVANLSVVCRVAGEVMQDGNTGDLIFDISAIVSYLSQVVELRPGDAIFTGTPAGVGDARTPPRYLADGDVVEVEIGPLGLLSNPCTAE